MRARSMMGSLLTAALTVSLLGAAPAAAAPAAGDGAAGQDDAAQADADAGGGDGHDHDHGDELDPELADQRLARASTVYEAPEDPSSHVLIFTATAAGDWHDAAIEYGAPVLRDALADADISAEITDDPTIFNDEDLARFDALVMFNTNGDPWSAAQKAAMETFQQAGGGITAIHNAADMRGGYDWWDDLIGSQMPGHAANPPPAGLEGRVIVEDDVHPSTAHLDDVEWIRSDEWYNFSTNVRGDAHVLLALDETSYSGGNMGYDHPISWCKPYDGGRAWVTAMGHFPAHYDEPEFVQHLVGGVAYAAGQEPGDCGGTRGDNFERVPLDQNTSAPFGLDIAPDGRAFFTELVRGEIRVYDPDTQNTSTALDIDVYSGGEDGMLAVALDPDFADNGWIYLYYSPPSDEDIFVNRVSRFTVGEGSVIDPASEVTIIEVPKQRFDQPGHTGGDLDFDNEGNLLLSVGDDINPHSEPSPSSAPLSTIEGTWHDARATSANTNDLRGKLLRITPEADGGYSIPEGNMFPEDGPDADRTRPEIYAMGFRNPFRFTVDPNSGAIGLADYGPDCSNSSSCGEYGPTGMVSWSLIQEPGNYGWPLCHGNKQAYRDVDYTTTPRTFGELFDCDAPINDSPRNTGLRELEPVVMPDLVYGYDVSTVPEVIAPGGGLAPMGGPFYDFDPELDVDTKFPEYFEGKPFFYEWAKNRMYSMIVDPAAPAGDRLTKLNPFLPPPHPQQAAPIDSAFGPDGSLYVLDWGGGFGRHNPDSGLYRIDYTGARNPEAVATATPDSGQAPLEVQFDGAGSFHPDGLDLSYAWDFDGDGEVDSTDVNPAHTYTSTGVFDARLTVTDPDGASGTTTVPITVGNTRPEVAFDWPPHGGFFEFGDEISWEVAVDDAEDEVDPADVIVQPALGHDEHAHSTDEYRGPTGSVTTSLGGHGADTNVFYALDARYTDDGGVDGVPALSGSDTVVLQPKRKQAEHHTSAQGVTESSSGDVETGSSAIGGTDGAWAAYDPVNLTGIDSLTLRVASALGGEVELRRDAPDGDLLGTAVVDATGGLSRYQDVTVDVEDPGESFVLYLVFTGDDVVRVNFFEADGKGISPQTRPSVRITTPDGSEALDIGEIPVAADASDAENTITEVEFFVDGDSIGTDTEAPFEVTWDVTEEAMYRLHAVATNDLGLTRTSRIVSVPVGERFAAGWETFSNTEASFDRPDANTFVIDANGANMWQSVDEYGAFYQPSAAGRHWTATVRINDQENTHNSAKAGLIVRNDVTDPGQSAGYAFMAMRAGNSFEWLRDTTGNGQLDASTGADTHGYPAWVRIKRSGDTYTAFWSKDGENFTQVGQPQVLPGAADVQDIGMAVTSHSGGATSRAEFEDFTLVEDDPVDPDPDPDPVPAPVCLGLRSDDFTGDELDRDRWTVVRGASGNEPTVSDGALVLPVTEGDINESSSGPISYVGQPLPDGAWETSARITLDHDNEWQHAGLMQLVDDDDYVKFAFTRNSAGDRLLEFQTETDGSRQWHGDNVDVPADFPSTVWMRLSSDGSELSASYSTDGESWTTMGGTAPIKSGGTLGIVAAGDTDEQNVDALVDEFRFSPDDPVEHPGMDDDFEEDALDGCRWNRIVRWDGDHIDVDDGQLRIETQPGDINGSNNDDPRNFILQDAPDGDWTVETQLTAPLLHRWQLAGLLLHADDDHYVKLDVVAHNEPGAERDLRVELRKEDGGPLTGPGGTDISVPASEDDTWWLRLTKTGDVYTGQISGDGETWVEVPGSVTADLDDPALGLMAIGPEQEEPVTVAFEHFRLVDEEPADVTAPTVSASLAGDRDDAGDFTGPVSVAIEATDEEGGSGVASVEYHLGDGAFTTYSEPLSIDEVGDHTVVFRATDAAGNVSDEGSVSFTIVDPDQCPDGDDRDTVVIGGVDSEVTNQDLGDGCTIGDRIDEDGPWRNHGKFVGHVRDVADGLVADEVIDEDERDHLVSAAARSDVGKPSRGGRGR